jgi:hypothetical protein
MNKSTGEISPLVIISVEKWLRCQLINKNQTGPPMIETDNIIDYSRPMIALGFVSIKWGRNENSSAILWNILKCLCYARSCTRGLLAH